MTRALIIALAALLASSAMGQTTIIGWCFAGPTWLARNGVCYSEDAQRAGGGVVSASTVTTSFTIARHCPPGYEIVLRQDMRAACAADLKEPER